MDGNCSGGNVGLADKDESVECSKRGTWVCRVNKCWRVEKDDIVGGRDVTVETREQYAHDHEHKVDEEEVHRRKVSWMVTSIASPEARSCPVILYMDTKGQMVNPSLGHFPGDDSAADRRWESGFKVS